MMGRGQVVRNTFRGHPKRIQAKSGMTHFSTMRNLKGELAKIIVKSLPVFYNLKRSRGGGKNVYEEVL